MKKRLIKNLLLVLTMVVLCFAVGVVASAEDRAIVDSGECGAQGDNVIWTLYDDGELVISGEGEMADYALFNDDGTSSWDSTAWHEYKIQNVTIEEGITHIGAAAFYSWYSDKNEMTAVEIAESVKSIGSKAFYGCEQLSDISIPYGVNEIRDYAFFGCTGITEIKIPNSVITIGMHAFSFCTSLGSVILPEGITNIGDHAFSCCTSLKSIVLPNSLKSLGVNLVSECSNLENITIGSNVSEIKPGSFNRCYNLSAIIVDENNPFYYSDENGVLFNKNKTILVQYPKGHERISYRIPDGVTTIGEKAFDSSFNLVEVIFPDSVTSIENEAFRDCFGLTNVVFPDSLISIGELAFDWCFGITSLDIHNNIKSVGAGAFADLFYLDEIYIKSIDADLDIYLFIASEGAYFTGISYEEVLPLWKRYMMNYDGAYEELEKYIAYNFEEIVWFGTIYCHSGSTAEAYAIENGIKYELTHFYEGEWTYDYENMIRYRKCIHCDKLETEALETTENGDVDSIAPSVPDADFTVDVITDYVIIEETLAENISGDFEIVKAFDINLKNKDGVHVQPDGTVKVKLPVDWSKEGVYKVYRVNDDGTLTDMNAYRQGSHMVFDTDHFSVYVIVDESEKVDTPTIPDEPQEETELTFWEKLIDLIKSFFELIMSLFKK